MICFCWMGFPQYAARCIGALVKSTDERVVVVATTPDVPVQGMREACGCEVVWIDPHKECRGIVQLLGELPRLIFMSGWSVPLFNRFRDEGRRAGVKAIAMVDNNYIFSVKEIFKSIRFRLFLRKKYDGFLVPGESGRRLLRFYGVKEEYIKTGLYSADSKLFYPGEPLQRRAKRIVYVGRFNGRKNIIAMCQAFVRANSSKSWTLELYGCGELLSAIPNDDCIEVHDFLQPEFLAGQYRRARAFCLASKEDHWGLVVHEAALSGCALLLSNRVGAVEDLFSSNGFLFDPFDDKSIEAAFCDLMNTGEEQYERIQKESLRLARHIDVRNFASSVLSAWA